MTGEKDLFGFCGIIFYNELYATKEARPMTPNTPEMKKKSL
jgi:hypothetical protein